MLLCQHFIASSMDEREMQYDAKLSAAQSSLISVRQIELLCFNTQRFGVARKTTDSAGTSFTLFDSPALTIVTLNRPNPNRTSVNTMNESLTVYRTKKHQKFLVLLFKMYFFILFAKKQMVRKKD
jgi:hypothetical protein